MRALLLAAGVAFAAVPAVSHAPVPVAPTHFQLVITPDGDGYSATCAAGCTWHTLGFSCSGECRVVIDNGGVHINSAAETYAPTFAFTFRPVAKGWQLESLAGTAWRSLGWRCGFLGACSAEVDETGVHGSAWI